MPCFFFCFLVPDLRCWSTSSCGGWQRTMLVGVFRDVNCQICPNHHTLITWNKVLKSVLPFDLTLPMPQLWNRNQTTATPHSAAVVQSHVQIQQVLRCESACRVMGGLWEAPWSIMSLAPELEAEQQRMLPSLSHGAKEEGCYRAHQKGCTGKAAWELLDQSFRWIQRL